MADNINSTNPSDIATPSKAAREASSAFIRGNGPWKEAEINLPDDDYAVQAFAKFERRTLEALRNPSMAILGAILDALPMRMVIGDKTFRELLYATADAFEKERSDGQ